ncbi:MAG: hypothetical protein L6Q33_07400 [Bacteriovoracaceae bacterium]|nr:hypothetical protein [Bacteriovoracaceae bacterium]
MSTSIFSVVSDRKLDSRKDPTKPVPDVVKEGLNERGLGEGNIPPSIDDKDIQKLEKVLNDYNADSKKVLENTQKFNDITDEELSEAEINELDQFSKDALLEERKNRPKPAYKKMLLPKDLESRKLSENVTFMLGPISLLSDEEITKLLKEKNEGSWTKKIFEFEPRLYPLAVAMLKDKEALPKLVSMSEKKDKFIVFFWWMLGTLVFSIILKKVIMNPTMPFFTALFWGFSRFVLINGIRIFIFWYVFQEELTPTIKIVKKVFFKTI